MDLKALFDISYGLFVVSSMNDRKGNGQICNTVIQVTAEPPRIAIAIHKDNHTHSCISNSKVFSASILDQDTPMEFIGHFGFNSGRDMDKLADVNFRKGKTGCPVVLDHATSVIECRVFNQLDVGSHTIFAGDLVDSEALKSGKPLTYAYYHKVKKGTSPKNAPTFKLFDKPADDGKLPGSKIYKCDVCGFLYNPDEGDPDHGVKPGTPFEALPDDWVCPACGAAKENFKPV